MSKKKAFKVWYNYVLWEAVSIVCPTKFDEYMILKRDLKDLRHEYSDTTPVSMTMIDLNNDHFYPDTPAVREAMKQIEKADEAINCAENELSFLDWDKSIKAAKKALGITKKGKK